MKIILGAGLSGIAVSYHLGHDHCLLLEQQAYPFGHIASEQRDGFTWDQGPHVSFTKHDYVRQLFQQSVGTDFAEFEVQVGNHYQSYWIDHPAQTALHQIPEPLRSACLASLLQTRARGDMTQQDVSNYQEWLELAFGPAFAKTFPMTYTQKYWTRSSADLTTDWIGNRILYPDVEDVKRGAVGPLDKPMHYITKVRYPMRGGYQSFAAGMKRGSNTLYGADVVEIDLNKREVTIADGRRFSYKTLINTLPLPKFIKACRNVPSTVLDASKQLACTQLLLVNISVPHEALRPEHWIYVYDHDKLSTRINFVEKLSSSNAPPGWSGIQIEVYFSRYRPLLASPEEISAQVEVELIDMGLIDPSRYALGQTTRRHIKYVPWANVIFDHSTGPALQEIWKWLQGFGMAREDDDLHPLTDWDEPTTLSLDARLVMAGRFGQWKYYWSDDCVLRGRRIAQLLTGSVHAA